MHSFKTQKNESKMDRWNSSGCLQTWLEITNLRHSEFSFSNSNATNDRTKTNVVCYQSKKYALKLIFLVENGQKKTCNEEQTFEEKTWVRMWFDSGWKKSIEFSVGLCLFSLYLFMFLYQRNKLVMEYQM